MRVQRLVIAAVAAAFLAAPIEAFSQERSEKPAPPATVSGKPIVGEVRAFAIPARPEAAKALGLQGWALANGRSLSNTAYPELAKAIGKTWGSADGANVFNVPDLRGMFIRGWDDGSGPDKDARSRAAVKSGGATGAGVGTLQRDALQSHKHDDAGHAHKVAGYSGRTGRIGLYDQSVGAESVDLGDSHARLGGPTTLDSGNPARAAFETRPVNVSVIYFVYAGRRVDNTL